MTFWLVDDEEEKEGKFRGARSVSSESALEGHFGEPFLLNVVTAPEHQTSLRAAIATLRKRTPENSDPYV